MAGKKNLKEDKEGLDNGESQTPASDSIKAKGDSGPATKLAIMLQTLSWMGKMKSEDLTKWHNDSIAQIGKESESIPNDEAEKNKASIAMKEAVAEDVAALFAGETLTEDFKTNAVLLFETAVETRIKLETARIEEETAAVLEEQIQGLAEEFEAKVDEYVSYAAEEWMKDNEVAVDASLRSELSEEFLQGLKALFDEHFINIPENKIEVVDKLATQIEDLETKLNDTIEANIQMAKELAGYTRQDVVDHVAEGLSVAQTEKFKTLSEGLDFDGDVETFEKKLGIVRDQYFKDAKKPAKDTINEQAEDDDEGTKDVVADIADPAMRNYANAIRRDVKKF